MTSPEGLTYKDAGVDVAVGDEASRIFYEINKETWAQREGRLGEVDASVDSFRGFREMSNNALLHEIEQRGGVQYLPVRMLMALDGIGTKIEIAERIQRHDTVGFDLVAMVIDDAGAAGAEAVTIGDVFDLNTFGSDEETIFNALQTVRQVATSLRDAALAGDVSVVTGEVAELGARIKGFGSGFAYNWCGSTIAYVHEDRKLTGEKVGVGDRLVAFEEKGFRSNGLSLVRKVLTKEFGKNWHEFTFGDNGQTLGEMVLEPSTIYARLMTDLHGGYSRHRDPRAQINGAAHITGGGIPNKLGDLLEVNGHGAVISEPFDPPKIMSFVQRVGKVSDREAYKWNMGQGMIVATSDEDEVIKVAAEHGINAKVIGEVVSEPGIQIKNRGVNAGSDDEWLEFPANA